MTNITIDGASIDFLKVKEIQLIKFMKGQSRTFGIYITLKDNCYNKEVQQVLDKLFNQRFWCLEEKNISIGRKFAIAWRSSQERHQQFYVLREDAFKLNHEKPTKENAENKQFFH
uniref:LAGLIDADG_2 domain-containing protein n=1 Tax=Panagrellus redivivus TaxID=6233 RepID=A0A7E4UYW9_PANRE